MKHLEPFEDKEMTAAPTNTSQRIMKRNYREFTFETFRKLNDNFYFSKAITAKNQAFETMKKQEKTKNPNLYPEKLFPSKQSQFMLSTQNFSNENFVQKTNNQSFLGEFLHHNLKTNEIDNEDLKEITSRKKAFKGQMNPSERQLVEDFRNHFSR